MADRPINQLTPATTIDRDDLYVLEQDGEAKCLSGQTLIEWLTNELDGHGGIYSIAQTSHAGTNPRIDTYTVTYADRTTDTFTVTNGVQGEQGDYSYVFIKYSTVEPSASAPYISDIPGPWMGIAIVDITAEEARQLQPGERPTPPSSWSVYTWYEIKGSTGDASAVTDVSVQYQVGDTDGSQPSGVWTDNIPTVPQGYYLWTKIALEFNNDDQHLVVAYLKARQGVDGSGQQSISVPPADSLAGYAGDTNYWSPDNHSHPFPQAQALSFIAGGTTATADMKWNVGYCDTPYSYYFVRVGNVVFLSFAVHIHTATSQGTSAIFAIQNSDLLPDKIIDFVVTGQATKTWRIPAYDSGTGNITSSTSTTIAVGTYYGFVSWVVHSGTSGS